MSHFCRVALFVAIGASAALSLTACSPSNREECIAEAAKAPTAEGVNVGTMACYEKFPDVIDKVSPLESNKNVSGTREICHVYWDGAKWRIGKGTKENFIRLGWSVYGVDLALLYIPNIMAKDFDISNKETDFYSDNKRFRNFFDENYYQIKILCNI